MTRFLAVSENRQGNPKARLERARSRTAPTGGPETWEQMKPVPTHEGGERVVTDLHEMLVRNSEAYKCELERSCAEKEVGAPSA